MGRKLVPIRMLPEGVRLVDLAASKAGASRNQAILAVMRIAKEGKTEAEFVDAVATEIRKNGTPYEKE